MMSEIFPSAVYSLCFLTSSACAFLLFRSFSRTKARLLLWSALCFLFLALNNLVVVVDLILIPYASFGILRVVLSLAAVCLLLFGLVWGREEGR
jgi:hypothetical protein